jgi:hypothetical protein
VIGSTSAPRLSRAFGCKSMRLFGLCAAVILCAWKLSATQAAEHFGQWSLEQPDDFLFALSFKRSTLLDDRAAASQLAFICNQQRKDVAVLMPHDGKVHKPTRGSSCSRSEDRRKALRLNAMLGKWTRLYIFGAVRRARGTCHLSEGQGG